MAWTILAASLTRPQPPVGPTAVRAHTFSPNKKEASALGCRAGLTPPAKAGITLSRTPQSPDARLLRRGLPMSASSMPIDRAAVADGELPVATRHRCRSVREEGKASNAKRQSTDHAVGRDRGLIVLA